MTFVELVSILLLLTSLSLIVGHHIKLRLERLQPTLRHRLFASHFTTRVHRAR